MQFLTRRGSDVDLELDARLDRHDHGDATLANFNDAAFERIARAQAGGAFGADDDIAGANSDAQAGTDFGAAERHLELASTESQSAKHRSLALVERSNGCVEDIFEADDLRDGFLARSAQHVLGHTAGNHAAGVEYDHVFSEREGFFGGVSDVEDGDAVAGVPRAQVVDNGGL